MIVLNADDLVESLASEVVDVEMGEEGNAVKDKSDGEDMIVVTDKVPLAALGSSGTQKKKTVMKRLDEVDVDIRTKRINNKMVFAIIREEQDYQLNEKEEDRVFIAGMTSDVAKPTGDPEMRNWIKEIVAKTLD